MCLIELTHKAADVTNNITYNTFYQTENLVHLFHKYRFVAFLVLRLLENEKDFIIISFHSLGSKTFFREYFPFKDFSDIPALFKHSWMGVGGGGRGGGLGMFT